MNLRKLNAVLIQYRKSLFLPDLDNIKFSIMFYGAITIVLCINYLGEILNRTFYQLQPYAHHQISLYGLTTKSGL